MVDILTRQITPFLAIAAISDNHSVQDAIFSKCFSASLMIVPKIILQSNLNMRSLFMCAQASSHTLAKTMAASANTQLRMYLLQSAFVVSTCI